MRRREAVASGWWSVVSSHTPVVTKIEICGTGEPRGTDHCPLAAGFRQLRSYLSQNCFYGGVQGAIHRETTRTLVPAAAEFFGDARDVQRTLASEADAETPVGELPEKSCHLRVTDGERVIHQTFAVLFDCSRTFHLFLRRPNPREWAFALQSRKRGAQQAKLSC